MDPVALKVQALIPAPTNLSLLTNNGIYPYLSQRVTIDSGLQDRPCAGPERQDILLLVADENRQPILTHVWRFRRPASADYRRHRHFHHSDVQRINFDDTLSPTLLFHAGIGYQDNNFTDDPPVLNYNPAAQLGLTGATVNRLFPNFVFPASQPQGRREESRPRFQPPSVTLRKAYRKHQHHLGARQPHL